MLAPLLLSLQSDKAVHGITLEKVYRYVGISRQGFDWIKQRNKKCELQWDSIVKEIEQYRLHKDRRAGSRSLYFNLGIKAKLGIGINKFEKQMAARGLTLTPLRLNVVTTKSCHQSWNYPNLVNGITIDNINQVVAGDLTYISHYGKRYYLFCITDLYSARIVGYKVDVSMAATNAKTALDMWLGLRNKKNLVGCIHHTDGGSQYFSALYLNVLGKTEVRISRAENCLNNAYAEQRNGFIKNHLLPTIETSNEKNFFKEIDRMIKFYNHDRKQAGLKWMSPVDYEKSLAAGKPGKQKFLYKFESE